MSLSTFKHFGFGSMRFVQVFPFTVVLVLLFLGYRFLSLLVMLHIQLVEELLGTKQCYLVRDYC